MLAQPDQSEETFVLLDDNVPVGTASLVNHDMLVSAGFNPMVSECVSFPFFREKGYSAALVRRVEEAAILSATTLWLYTWSGETGMCKASLATRWTLTR